MGITRDLNVEPYFDDFEPVAVDKNYHRILFKPSVAVQARELTQIQSILQNQIERFGDNILVEGTIVKGGNFVEINPLPYVKILDNDVNNRPVVLENYVGFRAVGATSGVVAQVITFAEGFQSQSPNLNTLFVKYISASVTVGYAGTDTFRETENINIINSSDEIVATVTVAGTRDATPIGSGYGVRCGEGIIYQKGHFIQFDDQIVVLEKYSTIPNSVVVGFSIQENFVDSFTDETLLDNAAGFPNENAPGADRLELIPVLEVRSLAEAQAENNYFIIQEYQNGRIVRKYTRTQYNILGDEMARRTEEESGNYAINTFNIRLDEFTANTELSDDLLTLSISPGTAYVSGRRVELVSDFKITINKATDSLTEPQQNISTNYGNYVVVTDYLGDFDFTSFDTVELRSAAHVSTSLNPAGTPASPGTVLGTARVRAVTKETNDRFRLYLFDINMDAGQFSAVRSIRFAGAGQAALANAVLSATNTAELIDTSFTRAIFPIGRSYIKTLPPANTDYITRVKTTQSLAGTTSFSIVLTGTDQWTYSGALNTDQINEFVIVPTATSGDFTQGVAVTTAQVSSMNVTSQTLSIVLNAAVYTGDLIVYHNVKKTQVTPIGKELQTGFVRIQANTHTEAGTSNFGRFSLGVPDGFDILNVWKGANTTFTEAEAISDTAVSDVTNQFTMNRNQRDSFYDLSYIQKKTSLTIGADDVLLVKFRAFTKNTAGEFSQSFFSVDSYPIDDTLNANNETISTQEIPMYSSVNGITYNLRDCIDFRPYTANVVAITQNSANANTLNNSIDELSAVINFGTQELFFPAPNEAVESDYEFFVGRIDKVYIDPEGSIQVAEGESSEDPGIPSDPSRGMTLATLYIPPFPSLPAAIANRAGHPEYAVAYTRPNNRRYTMSDIGKLDRRLTQIEYYTTLNSLEQKTDNLVILDGNNQNRFKNGIFVDNFEDYTAADVKNPQFSTSINPSYGEIAPRHRQHFLNLKTSSISSLTDHGEAITLPFSEVALINQPYASRTKSCTTNFYKYTGTMSIFPEYDGGPDTTRAPDIQFPDIDLVGAFSDFSEALNELLPFQRETSEVVGRNTVTNTLNTTVVGRTTTTFFEDVTTTNIRNTSTSLNVTQGNETSQVVGDFITDTRFLPYLRSVQVEIEIFGMMPNKRMYFFFDGQDVNAHIASATKLSTEVLSERNSGDRKTLNRTSAFSASNEIVADSNGVVRAIFRIPEETFYVGDRLLEVSSEPLYNDSGNAVTYAKKMYRGFNFSAQKSALTTTTRSPNFEALSSTTFTTVTSRNEWDRVVTQPPPFAFLAAPAPPPPPAGGGGSDPIAQTFYIDNSMSSDSAIQVTSVDVYFSSKSSAGNGVSVQICETINGYPSSTLLPFAAAHLDPENVNVDQTGAATPTTFTFSAPVTLSTEKEYALIIQPDANDPDYRVWISKTGETDVVTNIAVTQDTNSGVLFTSTNKRAWTPYQDENLKFTLNRAIYSSSTGAVTLTNKDNEFLKVGNLASRFSQGEFAFIEKTSGDTGFIGTGSGVIIQQGNTVIGASTSSIFNGIEDGDYVVAKNGNQYQVFQVRQNVGDNELVVKQSPTFSNTAVELFKTTVGEVSALHVSSVDNDTLLILENSSADADEVFEVNNVIIGEISGASCTVSEIYNIPVSYMNPNVYKAETSLTRISMTYDAKPLPFGATKHITGTERFVKSRSNEIAFDSGVKSFSINVTLRNTSPTTADTSPFLDHQISNMMIGEYIINDVSTESDAGSNNSEITNFGNANSKYLTQAVELASGMDASDLRVYVTGYRPPSSDIRVYVKVLNLGDSRVFDTVNWTELTLRDSDRVFSASTNRFDFKEFSYEFPVSASAAAGGNIVKIISGTDIDDEITYIAPNGNTFNTYKYFAIKVVLSSSSHTKIPRVRDVRAIALA